MLSLSEKGIELKKFAKRLSIVLESHFSLLVIAMVVTIIPAQSSPSKEIHSRKSKP
jgi:hypothetical protein